MPVQYCSGDRDITGDVYAYEDADEIRIWTEGSDLVGAMEDQGDGTWRAYDDSGNEYVGSKVAAFEWIQSRY